MLPAPLRVLQQQTDFRESFKLINVLDPTLAQDAATKKLCRYCIKLKQ
jgi:hypothetical protein